MPCDPALIACQLSQLVENTRPGWDWNSFAATLIATLLGAGIGLFGVWLSFSWQKNHRYREVFDDSVVRAIEETAGYAIALRKLQRQGELVHEYDRAGLDYFAKTGERALDRPEHLALSTALDIAEMRARRKDRKIITDALRTFRAILAVQNLELRLQMLGILSGQLARWRAKRVKPDAVLKRFAEARAIAEPDDVDVP